MVADKRFAVVGQPVAHSLSPLIHRRFADAAGIELEYETLAASPEDFEAKVRAFFAAGGAGLNVTLPHKEAAVQLASEASELAASAGAGNTLCPVDGGGEGQFKAYNTDGLGLRADLAALGVELQGRAVLLLGAGGAARGIVEVLLQANPVLLVVANRTMAKAQTLAERFGLLLPDVMVATADPSLVCDEYVLAINATSFGRDAGDAGGELPPALQFAVDRADFCYDLGYSNPPREDTAFCAAARRAGKECSDGLGMLVRQAAESFEIWHGVKPEVDAVLDELRQG